MDHGVSDSEDDDLQSSGGFSSSSEEEEEKNPLHSSTTTPCSAYRLTFGASGLRKRKDRLASLYHFPDVCLALYLDNRPLWKTEVIKHATEPVWEAFVLHRERIGAGDISDTVLRVEVWDWRDGEVHLVGQTSVPFATLITPGFEAPLINPKKRNSFSLRGKYKDSGKVQLMSVTEERDLQWSGEPPRGYEMVIRGDKLDAKDISKVSSSHSFLLFKTAQGVVHRTEVVKGTVQPRWKPILLELDHVGALGKYYHGWRRKQILHPSREVEQQQPWLDEYIANGRHELIGVSPVLCLRDFLTCTRYQFTLINKEKKEREVPVLSDFSKEFTGMSVRVPYRHSGILYVETIETIPEDLDEPQLIPEAFILDMSANKLDNRGLTKAISAAPNPFLRIRTGAWGGNRVIFQTEHDIKTEEPHWKPFALTVAECGGIRQNIIIECLHCTASGEDELIGRFEASLVELTSEKLDTYFFVNPSKIDWIGYRHSGKLKVCYFRPISAQEAQEFIEGYHVTLAPLLLAPPPLFPHVKMPHGCFVKIWNVDEGALVAQTEVIMPESVQQDRWRPLVLDIGKVPSIDTLLDFDVWWKNYEDEQMDLLLGTFRSTLRRFSKYQRSPQFAIGRPQDAQQNQLSSAVVGLARDSEHSVSIHRSGEGNYEEVHIHAVGHGDARSAGEAKGKTIAETGHLKGEYEDMSPNGKGKEKEVDDKDKGQKRSAKQEAKMSRKSKQPTSKGEGSDPLSRLRRKTEDILGSGNGSRGARTSPNSKKKPASADRRSALGYLAVKEFWVVGVSEVDLTPLRKKKEKHKQAKNESGGGERVLNYAKTITHNLLPLMKTRGERSLDVSTTGAGESEHTDSVGASSSSAATKARTHKGGETMKPAWSFTSMMIPKTNSKDIRPHDASKRRRRKHEQVSHDTNEVELVEPSPVLAKEQLPVGGEAQDTESDGTESETDDEAREEAEEDEESEDVQEEEVEEEEEESASSDSRSLRTASPEVTEGSDSYADTSGVTADRATGDSHQTAPPPHKKAGKNNDARRKERSEAKLEKKKEEKEKKKEKGGPIYAFLSPRHRNGNKTPQSRGSPAKANDNSSHKAGTTEAEVIAEHQELT